MNNEQRFEIRPCRSQGESDNNRVKDHTELEYKETYETSVEFSLDGDTFDGIGWTYTGIVRNFACES